MGGGRRSFSIEVGEELYELVSWNTAIIQQRPCMIDREELLVVVEEIHGYVRWSGRS